MLAELSEESATGRIAVIYDEIRRFSGVPYVSSLQRYLATLPGVLEWSWDALRPALVSGVVQETGWRLAKSVRLTPPRPVSAAALGLDAGGLAAVRNIAANFVRVAPVNIVTGACLGHLLTGARPSGAGFADGWVPRPMLPPMPGNVNQADLPEPERAVLMRFATHVDGAPFIPALYRQIAHWPAVLAWLAEELGPRFADPETASARDAFRMAARDSVPAIVARLPNAPNNTVPDGSAPDGDTTQRVLATIDRYAETSPEMTMFGQLILDTLVE